MNPYDINCVDFRGSRPVFSVEDDKYYISCKYCPCQAGQAPCGGILSSSEGETITSCIPDTTKSCEMFPPQVDPATGSTDYWFTAGDQLQVDSAGNPHRVSCAALCECNLAWVLAGGMFQGTCPVQDSSCAPAPGMPFGYDSMTEVSSMTGTVCTFSPSSCVVVAGDIFMRAPMPDPTNFTAGVCYDANGRLPKKGPWSTPTLPYWGACSPVRVAGLTGPHAGCVSTLTDTWQGPLTSTECETNICSQLPAGECYACTCQSDCVSGTCVVHNPACAGAFYAGQTVYGKSIWKATCDACVCEDQASCSYDETLEINTCTPQTDCYDPLMGYVYAQFGKMSCEPTACTLDNSDPGNFACFSDLCNTTTTSNEVCAPRYCECEGPCIVT